MAGRVVRSGRQSGDKIGNEERLFRRIFAQEKYGHYEYKNGRIHLTDNAFNDREYEPSVDRATLCKHGAESAKNPRNVSGGEKNGVAVLVAKEIRSIPPEIVAGKAVDVEYRPTQNPAHSVILGRPSFTDLDFDLLKAQLCILANSRKLAIKPISKKIRD